MNFIFNLFKAIAYKYNKKQMVSATVFKFSRVSPDAVIPKRGSIGAAGYDLSSIEKTFVPARTWKAIDTGLVIQCNSEHYGRIAPRSGLAYKNGIHVMAGVIDSDYIGNIKVILYNCSNDDFAVSKGDRIAQIVFEKISIPFLEEVSLEDLKKTNRGSDGFGSTGVSNEIANLNINTPVVFDNIPTGC